MTHTHNNIFGRHTVRSGMIYVSCQKKIRATQRAISSTVVYEGVQIKYSLALPPLLTIKLPFTSTFESLCGTQPSNRGVVNQRSKYGLITNKKQLQHRPPFLFGNKHKPPNDGKLTALYPLRRPRESPTRPSPPQISHSIPLSAGPTSTNHRIQSRMVRLEVRRLPHNPLY
jgi:hypothetical protein